jgi:chromosome segregation ATPase
MILEQSLVDATEKFVKANIEITHLQRAVEAGNGEVSLTGRELAAVSAENKRLTTRLETQLMEMEALLTIEAEKQSLEVEVARKEDEIAQHQQEYDNADKTLNTLLAQISNLKSGLEDANTEIVHLKQTIEVRKGTSQSACETLATLQEEIEELPGKVDTQLKDNEALRAIQAEKMLLERDRRTEQYRQGRRRIFTKITGEDNLRGTDCHRRTEFFGRRLKENSNRPGRF